MKRIVPDIIAAGMSSIIAGSATALVAAVIVISTPVAARANSILPAITSARNHNTGIMKHYVEVDPGIWVAVKGARERRQVRFARLLEIWSDDQQCVARSYGFPVFRYRENAAGVTTEIWSYPDNNVTFVFDVPSGRLVERRVQ